MSRWIIVAAFLAACVSVVLAFRWFDATGNTLGWQCAAVALYLLALVARDRAH